MTAKPLSRGWALFGWLPLFLLTALIAIPPGLFLGPYFSQTSGPLARLPDLTWYKAFIWTLDILTPLVTLALLWGFKRLRGPLPPRTKSYWLGMVAAAVIVGCVAACYFVWQRPATPTLAEPDFAVTCWLFCGTLKSGFAVLAVISGALTAAVALALRRGLRLSRWLTTPLGLATLPIGLLMVEAAREPRVDHGS